MKLNKHIMKLKYDNIVYYCSQGNAFTKTQLYYDLHILDKSG